MVRVVHLIRGLPIGGAEMMLMKLLQSMDGSRFAQTVISLDNSGAIGSRISALGIPVHCLGISPYLPTVWRLWYLRRLFRDIAPDLVQGWMYHGNVASLIGRFVSNVRIPVVWNIRQSVYNLNAENCGTSLAIRFGARVSKRPAAIIYNSKVSARHHEALGYYELNRHIIHNGFNCDEFRVFPAARSWLRRELGYKGNTLLIGMIARYHPTKDHKNFLQAASRVAKRWPDVGFVLVGNGVHARNRELSDSIMSCGIANHVNLLGQRMDIAKIMAGLDLVVSSSWTEGFSNVIGEAMACGISCVVTDVGESSQIVGETGIVVPPRDSNALAQGCERLIGIGENGRRELGYAARLRIVEKFSMLHVTRVYESLYETIVADSGNIA